MWEHLGEHTAVRRSHNVYHFIERLPTVPAVTSQEERSILCEHTIDNTGEHLLYPNTVPWPPVVLEPRTEEPSPGNLVVTVAWANASLG